ncbi:MAG: hypothetical protein HRT72_13425 [Flavobacteriales bacterium]|nr:hypothetical protein [Flavobacteriales bacterium]
MKYLILTISILLSTLSVIGNMDGHSQKELSKVKKLYEKGELYKAIDKLSPIIKTHPKESELWSLMITYHIQRYKVLLDPV